MKIPAPLTFARSYPKIDIIMRKIKTSLKPAILLPIPVLLLTGVFAFRASRAEQETVSDAKGDALDQAMIQLAGPNARNYGQSQGYGVFPNDVFTSYKAGLPFYARQLILTPAQDSVISAGLVSTAKGQLYFINFKSPVGQPNAKGTIYAVQHLRSLGAYPGIDNKKGTQNVSFVDVTVLTPDLQKRLLARNYLSLQEIESSTGGRTRRTIE